MVDIVNEKQICDVSWYADPIGPEGTAKDNYERITELRKAFCHPLTIHEDGRLNDKYFSTVEKETAVNWSDIEILQLYEGIFKHGVDSVEKWIQIKGEFLPQRDFIEVRLKLTQLLGVQDLSIYKGRKFESEKEVKEEWRKNKERALKDGTWMEEGDVALKPEVAALTAEKVRKLENEELAQWNKFVFENPRFIYRPHTKQSREPSTDSKGTASNSNKRQSKAVSVQKNTLDDMIKKKEEDKATEKVKEDPPTKAAAKPSAKPAAKPSKKAAKKKARKPAKKGVPMLPESSDDEEMLCVE